MSQHLSQDNLFELIWLVCDGTASDEQFADLSARLDADPQALQLYVQYAAMHANLQWDYVGELLLSPDVPRSGASVIPSVPLPQASMDGAGSTSHASWGRTNLRNALTRLGTLAASLQVSLLWLSVVGLLVIGSGFLGWRLRGEQAQSTGVAIASPSPLAPAAYLTTANGCNWGNDSMGVWTVGRSVNSGDELTLHEGIAEFRLSNGVSLGIEGPASLMLVSPSTLVLQYGKLTAHVPWGTTDFKVVAAGCRIVARDAEFGISLTGSKLDVHVFSGEVTVGSSIVSARFDDEAEIDDDFVADDDESYFTDAVIAAGRVLRLTTHGEVLKIAGWDKAEPSLFVAKLSMSGPLPITREYVDRVMASRPVSYWRFEKIVDSKILNEIESGPSLKAKDKSELVGSNGNMSAEFHWNRGRELQTIRRLTLNGPDYSIEAWIKPSHLHQGNVVSLQSDHSRAHLELQDGLRDSHTGKASLTKMAGRLKYFHRAGQENADPKGTWCFSSEPYAIRRWQHVVAVKSESQMKLYIDGKLSSSTKDESSLHDEVYVRVGHLYLGPNGRRFIGQIDELAVYNRALTEKEISSHYSAVEQQAETTRPNQETKSSVVKPDAA